MYCSSGFIESTVLQFKNQFPQEILKKERTIEVRS